MIWKHRSFDKELEGTGNIICTATKRTKTRKVVKEFNCLLHR